ncbi:MAG: DUF4445 domain-containing protein [Proteobacteria bacterium]|nr:DUF4445 domain-containing protein [Pseudomonadota bacterium]
MQDEKSSDPRTAAIRVENLGLFNVRKGLNLREALRREGLYLDGTCADKGTCGRCVVRVLEGDAGVPLEKERALLGKEAIDRGDRLACRIRVAGDLELEIDPDRILDWEKSGRWKEVWEPSLRVPGLFSPAGSGYGVALDLGTTSIAAALYDLEEARPLDIRSAANPQIPWGDEIISRLGAARDDAGTAAGLQELLWQTVRELIRSLCFGSGVSPERITFLTAVGNSAVHHLSLGLPVGTLLTPPYSPFDAGARDYRAADPPFNLGVGETASIHFPPLVGGYAGSDALVSVLAVDAMDVPRGALLDVGTNTEIILWDEAGYLAASAPSGPAFEGGLIKDGMKAEEGAVWKVAFSGGDFVIDTLGDGVPKGICGTGIADAVASLLHAGALDPSGLLKAGRHPRVTSRGFILHDHPEIILRPEDIAEVQQAKGAISATFGILLERKGLCPPDLDRVFLSGAFGTRLNPQSAIAIGLLPPIEEGRVTSAGNTALIGASYVLLSPEARERAADLAGKIKYASVADDPEFQERFLDSLYFPQ